MKYSSGMALMYLPFFMTAHLLAEPLGYPADGFSLPYQFGIQIGGLLVAFLGLWYFRKLMLRFYSDKVAAISMFLLVFGTNYLNYAAIDSGMAHSWLFTLYVFILLCTIKFYTRPSFKLAVSIGLLCGLATLTRPTDIISALIPLLWSMESLSGSAIKKQFSFLKRHWKYIVVCALCAAAVFSIQLFYWKYATNDWIVYSYQGQGFTWLQPHVLTYLFSPQNGWLAYSPIMALTFMGLVIFLKHGKNKVAITCFTLLNLYIVSCWEFYWYGGRFMIQSYPILFIPLGCFLTWTLQTNLRKWMTLPLIILFAYVGLWTTIQLHRGNLYDFDTSSARYYLAVVGRWDVPESTFKLKDTDELFYGQLNDLKLIYKDSFENDTSTNCTLPPISGRKSICLNELKDRHEIYLKKNKFKGKWIRAEAKFYCHFKEQNVWDMTQFIVMFRNNGNEVKSRSIRVHRFLNNGETRRLFLDVKIPKDDFDDIKIAFWRMNSKQTVLVDDLKISTFKE
jgi:hypothetical protein